MNNISLIIATLTAEDKKNFVLRLKHRNKRNDTKNIDLFMLLDRQESQENLDLILYGKSAKGAYHALCKRLHDALIDFIASKKIEEQSSTEMNALKLVMVSRSFFQQQQVAIAFKTLAKAELIAKKYALYNTLNEVYELQLAHAHLNDLLNFQGVLKKFQKNKRKILQEENLNLFYAAIQNELSQKDPVLSDIIERNFSTYNISITKNLSYQSLFKILQISNQVANATRNYYDVLDFIEKARKKIEVSERAENEHLYYHIQVLYYLSNTYFRIKKFEKSATYLQRMHDHMYLQNEKYYNIFYCQYVLIENLLLIYTDNLEPVIQKLSQFNYDKYKNEEEHIHDLKLTLIVALFLNERFHDALNTYKGFFHSDKWYSKKVGFIWVIKKNLLEILLFIELDYIDLVESRLKSFRKKHSAHLIDHDEKRIIDYVNLIAAYYHDKQSIHSDEFEKKLDAILDIENREEDIFAISFYAWLRSKMKSEDTYTTCLNYINKL
ncbi:hypothetical protein QWY87_07410 [Lutimonas halocynthiae]|uniref:hypothetical protein n=1 Tax=Lutimonas halocynthiae TaxID=1446477 RepID=UPI0025B52A3F|nr:hypothetical protein [Lutimonas halocynthiae]MDN3642518.1 hypothetical protein [Lutimonas halocynthiae]